MHHYRQFLGGVIIEIGTSHWEKTSKVPVPSHRQGNGLGIRDAAQWDHDGSERRRMLCLDS